MEKIYEKYIREFEDTSAKLSSPEIASDHQMIRELSKRHNELEEIVNLIREAEILEKKILGNAELVESARESADEELKSLAAMAEEENTLLMKQLASINAKLQLLTVPRDPDDARDVILEIRAGAGGDEAGLFASELFRVYSKYAENHGFKVSIYSSSRNEVGGTKELVAQITGKNVYGALKFESGVHRVQRIPETEKSGRIHTSTATVAVLPEAEETDIEIKNEDIRIDTFRSSGPGGQHVNTTDSAVRLTHLPTGVVVSCQDEKSQHKNKLKALSVLRSRLLQAKREEEQRKQAKMRSSQIGTGDRSEKIRTYNFPQDRITDHRIKQSWHGIEKIMEGYIEPIIEALQAAETKMRLDQSKEQ